MIKVYFFENYFVLKRVKMIFYYRGGPFDCTEKGPLDGTEKGPLDGTEMGYLDGSFEKNNVQRKNGLYHRTVPPVRCCAFATD